MTDLKVMLSRLMAGQSLERDTVNSFFGELMDGGVAPEMAAGILVALRMKGETGVELAAAAAAMRSRVVRVPIADPGRAVDTCGTGGDGAGTINISTAAALVAAAAGVPVAKHGNRSVSSRCGSADVLEAAGVRLSVDAEGLGRLHDELGIAFLFAPRLHPAMGAVMPVRKALGVRTSFNLLGPLTNPAMVGRQVMGVWAADLVPLAAGALAELGAEHALVVHSDDGLDELSVAAPSVVAEVRDGEVQGQWRLDPAELGVEAGDPAALQGGDQDENRRRLESLLGGRESSAASEAVALNTGAALYVGGAVASVGEGLARAREVLSSGSALELLGRLATRSQELSASA